MSLPDFSKVARQLKRSVTQAKRDAMRAVGTLAYGLSPPPDDTEIPPETKAWARRAFNHLSDCSSIKELQWELAEDTGLKPVTFYKWLCERNPLYEPGGTVPQRWARLKTAVRRIVFFT